MGGCLPAALFPFSGGDDYLVQGDAARGEEELKTGFFHFRITQDAGFIADEAHLDLLSTCEGRHIRLAAGIGNGKGFWLFAVERGEIQGLPAFFTFDGCYLSCAGLINSQYRQ